jgi:hypothetical protein
MSNRYNCCLFHEMEGEFSYLLAKFYETARYLFVYFPVYPRYGAIVSSGSYLIGIFRHARNVSLLGSR